MKCSEICPIGMPPIGTPERKEFNRTHFVTIGKVDWGGVHQPISLDVEGVRLTVYRNVWASGVVPFIPPSAEPSCRLPRVLSGERLGNVMITGCPYIRHQNYIGFNVEPITKRDKAELLHEAVPKGKLRLVAYDSDGEWVQGGVEGDGIFKARHLKKLFKHVKIWKGIYYDLQFYYVDSDGQKHSV